MLFKRIKELREKHGLSKQQVAEYLNIASQTYCRYEKGLRKVPTRIIIKLALLYNTSVDYIVDRVDIDKPYSKPK